MSAFILVIHITGAVVAVCVSVFALIQTKRASLWSRMLSLVFVSDILSGLAFAISRDVRVLSVCDNLALYAFLFALVQAILLYRANSRGQEFSSLPLFGGLGIGMATVFLVLLAGF